MDYDVIIAGSGPAGSVLGKELARRGLAVLILEKEKLPRYKPCGGGITSRAYRLLDTDLSQLVEDQVRELSFTYRYSDPLTITTPEPLIYMVMRDRLDHLLAKQSQAAGAELWEETPLEEAREEASSVQVVAGGKVLHTRLLVGADGARSRVASLFFPPQRLLGIALEAEVEVAPKFQEACRGKALLNHGSIREGYDWIFPKSRHLSVGTGTFKDKTSHLKAHYLEAEKNLLREPVKRNSWRGHLLPSLKEANPYFHTARTLLLGDAAGLVDPLSGEGIYGAVQSALLAAEVIPRAVREARPDLNAYTELLRRELVPELLAAGRMAKAVYTAPRLFFRLVKANQDILERLARVIAGQGSYASLLDYLRGKYFYLRPLL